MDMIMQEWWLASVIHSLLWMRCVRATVICTHRRDIISQDHSAASHVPVRRWMMISSYDHSPGLGMWSYTTVHCRAVLLFCLPLLVDCRCMQQPPLHMAVNTYEAACMAPAMALAQLQGVCYSAGPAVYCAARADLSCYRPACKGHSSNPTASPPSLPLCPLCLPLQLPQLLIKVPTPCLDAGLPAQWQFTNGSISRLRFEDL